MAVFANTMIEYPKAGDQMNDNVNNKQAVINALAPKQKDNDRNGKNVPTALNSRVLTIEDTTVNLSFTDSGDLNTRLANAFQTMLKS